MTVSVCMASLLRAHIVCVVQQLYCMHGVHSSAFKHVHVCACASRCVYSVCLTMFDHVCACLSVFVVCVFRHI